MVLEGDDANLEELVKGLESLFSQPQAPAQPATSANIGYQSPIKGTFYNSGGFTPGSATPNHPSGHAGIDMRTFSGVSVYPMAPGVVTNVGTDPKGGNIINITHANNVKTYYAHLGTVTVHKGDKVDNNTVIGTIGNTGNARLAWPHLHLQVWKDGQLQDPATFFTVPKYTNLNEYEKKHGMWLTDQSKQDALKFDMKKHLHNKTVIAKTNYIDKLYKIASLYYKYSINF